MPNPTKNSPNGKVSTRTQKISRVRRVLAWGLLVCLGVLIVGGIYIGQNRYDILEGIAQKRFAKMGYDASFEIEIIQKNKAVINDIIVRQNGKPVFRSERFQVSYAFKDMLKGQFEHIVIKKAHAFIELGPKGDVVYPIFPQSAQSGSGVMFPENGVVVEDSAVHWKSPFGGGVIGISANIPSENVWSMSIDGEDVLLKQKDVRLMIDMNGDIEKKPNGDFLISGAISHDALNTPVVKADDVKTNFNVKITEKNDAVLGLSGWLSLVGEGVKSDQFSSKNTNLKLDVITEFDRQTSKFLNLTAQWDVVGRDIRLLNRTRRQEMSRKIMAYDALVKTPIAQYFADDLPQNLDRLLASFSLSAAGEVFADQAGYEIRISDDLIMHNSLQKMSVQKQAGRVFKYSKQTKKITLNANVDWTSTRELNLRNVIFEGVSNTGHDLESVNLFSAKIISPKKWEKRLNNHNFSLAPFTAFIDYETENNQRQFKLAGRFEYDGLVPGGAVKGLRFGGDFGVSMQNDGLRLGYVPDSEIVLNSFESPTKWRVENIKFSVEKTKDLLRIFENNNGMNVLLKRVKANVISPSADRHLDISVDKILLQTHFEKTPQIWNFTLENTKALSDDFPSVGTKIVSKNSDLKVIQSPDGGIQFKSNSPDMWIETQNVRAKHIAIEVEGRPDDFTARYQTKRAEFVGGDIPALPMKGSARMRMGMLTGDAVTDLPFTENTPIHLTFDSVDGHGRANIDIPSIVFTPNGLQPQNLVSTLKGKLANVSGEISAQLHFAFGGGKPIQSYGTTHLNNIDVGTLVGPITGVNTELKFSSIFPLKTEGVQHATLAGFDPGFLLENGEIDFEIIPGGIRIDRAVWPVKNIKQDIKNGKIFIAPLSWRFGGEVNTPVVHIEDIDLSTVLARVGKDRLSATGNITGVLPAQIDGVNVVIVDGYLEIKEGGVIQLKRTGPQKEVGKYDFAGLGMKALEDFKYENMKVSLNGPLDGDVTLDMDFEGYNAEVLNGQSFKYDMKVSGELANIARNLTKSVDQQTYLDTLVEEYKGK